MKLLTITIATLASLSAHADGFRCHTEAETGRNIAIALYNKVNPEDGTRSVAKMIVSDPSLKHGRKTIATFSADAETLETDHKNANTKSFIGLVDLRFNESNRKGEYILGTRLGEVDTIELAVDFTYGEDLADGDVVDALVRVVKRNGQVQKANALCERYLKGE